MTTEELKDSLPMRQIVESYGVKVKRDGMCCCPIHGERNASMKVYKDSFNCFACGANGDIFTFVMLMDHCDFKTAFLNLGGTYEKTTAREKTKAKYLRESVKNARQIADNRQLQVKLLMIECFDKIKISVKEDVPYSDRWCLSQNMLPKLTHWWDVYISGEGIDVKDVYRGCKHFIERYDFARGDSC